MEDSLECATGLRRGLQRPSAKQSKRFVIPDITVGNIPENHKKWLILSGVYKIIA